MCGKRDKHQKMGSVDRRATKETCNASKNDIENGQAMLQLSPEGLRLWKEAKEQSQFF